MERTRLLLANNHPIIRGSLRALLERETFLHVIGEAADAAEAILLAEYLHPDVIVLDLNLKPSGGIAVARDVAHRSKAAKLVLVADQNDEEYVIESFKAGVRGYVAADKAPGDLMRAVKAVLGGRRFVSPSVSARLLERHARADLPEDQKELYCLLAAGYSEDELSARWHAPADQIRKYCEALPDLLRKAGVPEIISRSAM